MVTNLLFNTNPIIFHAPGHLRLVPLWDKVASYRVLPFSDCDELSIITWNNGGFEHMGKRFGTFEKTLGKLKHTVLCQSIKNWTSNRLKIKATIDFLETCQTPYVFAADTLDVLLKGEPKEILRRFLTMNCDMLFNAEAGFWPHDGSGLVKPAIDFERSVPNKGFKHLNGGVWIGKTSTCLEFFKNAAKLNIGPGSEQIILKIIYKNFYPQVKLDHCCNIFQIITDFPQDKLIVEQNVKLFL